MKKTAVLFSGNGTNFKYILENLHDKHIDIVLALTNNLDARGIEFAKEFNIPLVIENSKNYKCREEFDTVVVEQIIKSGAELTILAGFMRILTPVFTDNIYAINLHPSLLPRHKGLDAIKKSYEDEFTEGGVSVHHVTSELDGGDIIIQKSINKYGLTFDEYNAQIRDIEKIALKEAILKLIA